MTATPIGLRILKGTAVASLLLAVVIAGVGCSVLRLRPSVDVESAAVVYREDPARPPGLHAVFFGTSTLLLSDGATSIMIDGFFSRPSFLRLATSIEPAPEEIGFALQKAPGKIDAIFVAHSHHDHAMDSGLVAQKTGAVLYGSESTLNVARGENTPAAQLRQLTVERPMDLGRFRVTAFETPHSPDPLNPGFIEGPVHPPAKLGDYRMAENFSFLVEHQLGKVLIVPSANFRPGAFGALRADIVVLGIGTLGKQEPEFTLSYWDEVVRKTGAKLVLPVHWDDFTRSLRHPLVPLPYFMDNMRVSMERLRDLARRDGVEIRVLPTMREVILPAAGRAG